MRKHLSVLMLAVRSSIYKVILLIAATGAVQAALFARSMGRRSGLQERTLAAVLEDSHIDLAAGLAFVLLCVILSLTGCEFGSKLRYTLRRLAVRERTVSLWWALYNTGCFAIFWMSQMLVTLALCRWFGVNASGEVFGPQTVFLAYYLDPYLHSLMPMAEVSRWIRNILLCISLGISAAAFSQKLRAGKKGVAIFVLAVIVLWGFRAEMALTDMDVIPGLAAVIIGGVSFFGILMGGECEDEGQD